MVVFVIGVVYEEHSFRDFVTPQDILIVLWIHRQVCCDKIPLIAVKSSPVSNSFLLYLPLSCLRKLARNSE